MSYGQAPYTPDLALQWRSYIMPIPRPYGSGGTSETMACGSGFSSCGNSAAMVVRTWLAVLEAGCTMLVLLLATTIRGLPRNGFEYGRNFSNFWDSSLGPGIST